MEAEEMIALAKLRNLHEFRRTKMSWASIYHGSYENEAIRMNKELKEISGKNYSEYSMIEIEKATAYLQGFEDGKR